MIQVQFQILPVHDWLITLVQRQPGWPSRHQTSGSDAFGAVRKPTGELEHREHRRDPEWRRRDRVSAKTGQIKFNE